MSYWTEILPPREKTLLENILSALDEMEDRGEVFYPEPRNIFRALYGLESTKVVILGQDPYHRKGQANGFAFAVNREMTMPPSLANIFKELESDIGHYRVDRTLEHWAQQGVLLLNSALTVLEGKPGSHADLGWHKITNRVIKHLSDEKENLPFILWGKHAQTKAGMIDDSKHHIILSPHPSPLSAHSGFFGSKPFSRTNKYLESHNLEPIIW